MCDTCYAEPRWYAIHSKCGEEVRAERNLNAWGVPTFFPRMRGPRPRAFLPSRAQTAVPLFPGYLFARFIALQQLHSVRFTRGVRNVVSFGGPPLPVEDDVIELIRSRVSDDGLVDVGSDLKKGDAVIVESGPLRNLQGVFERYLPASDRVIILIATISYQARVCVGSREVQMLTHSRLQSL